MFDGAINGKSAEELELIERSRVESCCAVAICVFVLLCEIVLLVHFHCCSHGEIYQ